MGTRYTIRSVNRTSGTASNGIIRFGFTLPLGEYEVESFLQPNTLYNIHKSQELRGFNTNDPLNGPFYSLSIPRGVYTEITLLDLVTSWLSANAAPVTVSFDNVKQSFQFVVTGIWGMFFNGEYIKKAMGAVDTLFLPPVSTVSLRPVEMNTIPYFEMQLNGSRGSVDTDDQDGLFVVETNSLFGEVISMSDKPTIKLGPANLWNYSLQGPLGELETDSEWILVLVKK